MGKKRVLTTNEQNKKNIKELNVVKYFMEEIANIAICCCLATLFGLVLGFAFLQVQTNT